MNAGSPEKMGRVREKTKWINLLKVESQRLVTMYQRQLWQPELSARAWPGGDC
jgi:hypothetical protein